MNMIMKLFHNNNFHNEYDDDGVTEN